ncbi:hypothetical protein ENBRE01_3473, partial [Enteropsectra breve]
GAQSDIVPEIFESLCRMNAKSCTTSLKCAAKVFDGYLYLMEGAMQFLPKPINIPLSDILYVEFSRINLSMAQAKTIDMTVHAEKVYNFNGIHKDHFNALEVYLRTNGIKIVSEVIDDAESEESEDYDESNLSDIIDSDE